MHKLLVRQLRRFFGSEERIPPEWKKFIDAVNEAYEQSDADRHLLERSMDLASDELLRANKSLRSELEVRERTEAELKHAASLLQSTLDSSADGILVTDLAGKITLFNQRFLQLWKLPQDIVDAWDNRRVQAHLASLAVDPERFLQKVQDLYAQPQSEDFEEIRLADGRSFERYSIPQRLDKEAVGRVWSYRDVTSRANAEEELRLTQFAMDRAGEAIFWIHSNGAIFYANEAACRSLNYSRGEINSKTIHEIDPDLTKEVWATHWNAVKERVSFTFETHHRRKDGSRFPVEATVTYLAFNGREYNCLFARDITKREEKQRQGQKMAAIGRLAGGVAHDFNNILTAILGYSELLLKETPPRDPRRIDLVEIRKAGERGASLTSQLLAFSRQQVLQWKVTNLNTLVSNMERMLRRLIGVDIDLVTAFEPDVWRVKIDPSQMEQVLLNLVVNARDAMPQGGQLIVSTQNVELKERDVRMREEIPPGRYAVMGISDTGAGMDAEVQSHLFEPFFTTKPQGKGTGLGLSTVYGIVKQSGGYITVASAPGRGTEFQIFLPRVEEESPAAEVKEASGPLRGSETILLVEDEEPVRSLTRKILQKSGYSVLEARQGDEALTLSERYTGPIHLLMTDVIMPVLNGVELARRLLPTRPETKVLFVSGYTDHPGTHGMLVSGATYFLQKPFTPEAVARKVREVLDTAK